MPVQQARAILAHYWNRQIPVDPSELAMRMGASVVADTGMRWTDLSGRFDFENGRPTIRFNPDDAWVRQRFTIAHELGHMVLNHGQSMRDNAANYSTDAENYREREANAFAAELLMPKEVVDWMASQNYRDVGLMSRQFGVSEAAMRFRLINLGYLSSSGY
jgi:Zn-dependent peptidase ImmA (M78 family)